MAQQKKIARIFIALNILIVFIYLLACLVPFLNAGEFWFIAILGLIFPLLFFAMVLFLIGGLIARSRYSWLTVIALLLSWQQLAAVFSWHLPKTFTEAKAPGSLRIFQWNVSSWDERSKTKREDVTYRGQMFAEVKKSNADILCFEEFLESEDSTWFAPTIVELTKMGYPYHYYKRSYENKYKKSELGIIIFSKYPIENTGTFDFGDRESVQQLIYADVQYNNQTIRVFAIHLQSVRFGKKEYKSITELKHSDKSGLNDSKTIVSKLKRGYQFRSTQAEIVRSFIDKSPYPVILCGDFNDVPNSYTYFTIRGNLQDAFLQQGSGIGRTFRFISPTLRIDYILADKKFSVNQYYRLTVPYSDHYGVMADMSLDK